MVREWRGRGLREQRRVRWGATYRGGAILLLVLAGLATVAGFRSPGGAGVAGRSTWRLVWSDEFSGPAGTPVDARKWTAEVGGQGWGNQEREYYTDRVENAHLDGKGHLALVARKETLPDTTCWYGTCLYTSARLKTQDTFTFRYGRVEARIRIPHGQGYWPAFWMLGADIDTVGWPRCGEVDIMENVGSEPGTVHGSAHGPGYSGATPLTAALTLPGGRPFAEGFHTFAVEWAPRVLRWYVDGALYQTITPADLPAGSRWVYDHPFFLLLNVAVGGQWPGDPDASTVFPQAMLVDYVRVYQQTSAPQRRVASVGGPVHGGAVTGRSGPVVGREVPQPRHPAAGGHAAPGRGLSRSRQ